MYILFSVIIILCFYFYNTCNLLETRNHTVTQTHLSWLYYIQYLTLLHCTLNVQYLTLLSLHTITVLPLTTVYFVSEVHCTLNVQYLTLLRLHTITVLPLTTVYFVSEVHCTLNVLHSITP